MKVKKNEMLLIFIFKLVFESLMLSITTTFERM